MNPHGFDEILSVMHSQISQTTSCFLNSLIIKGIKFSTPSLHACMASAISTLKTQIINHSYSRKLCRNQPQQRHFPIQLQNSDWVNNHCKTKSQTNCGEEIKMDYNWILYKNFYLIKISYRQGCFLRSKLVSHENGGYCGVVDENW